MLEAYELYLRQVRVNEDETGRPAGYPFTIPLFQHFQPKFYL